MIIGISGYIGSGKDTVADYLTTFKGFKRMSYAGPLKDAVAAIFNWDRGMLEGTTKTSREWRDQVDPWWAERLNIKHLTPRWVLQQWGTEVGRRAFHDDIWIASIENQLRTTKDHVVISDCRFPNELKSIKRMGGITIRVSRGDNPPWHDAAIAFSKGYYTAGYPEAMKALEEHKVHASEYSSVGLDYDYRIDNNGTIDELHRQVNSIINL
jgi:hypothetical protein